MSDLTNVYNIHLLLLLAIVLLEGFNKKLLRKMLIRYSKLWYRKNRLYHLRDNLRALVRCRDCACSTYNSYDIH